MKHEADDPPGAMTEDELHTVWAAMPVGAWPPATIDELLARLRALKAGGPADPIVDTLRQKATGDPIVDAMVDEYLAGQKAGGQPTD
jgi:hypothetical protein